MSDFIRPVDVIAAHRYDEGPVQDCDCGWLAADGTWTNIATAHAAHVLEALAAHRTTVVTLPEPDSTSGKVSIWVTPVEDVRTTTFDEVVVGTLWWLQPYAARQFAAALLSAADVADRAGDDGASDDPHPDRRRDTATP